MPVKCFMFVATFALGLAPLLIGRRRSDSAIHGKLEHYGLSGTTYALGDVIEFPVEILLTRSGFSCDNIARNYSEGKKPARVPDSMLSTAGAAFTRVAGNALDTKFAGFNIDAVLTSPLPHAIHTAALQYRGYGPLWVVPHVSEPEKKTMRKEEQLDSLFNELRTQFSSDFDLYVNRRWENIFGPGSGGNWTKFKQFLANSFLPDLVLRSPRVPWDPPIALAVVTHSGIMKDAEVSQQCASFYTRSGPRNNQAVLLEYKFLIHMPNTTDCTPTFSLVPTSAGCEEVWQGVSLDNLFSGNQTNLCESDIGATCLMRLGGRVRTIEDDLQARAQELLEARIQNNKARSTWLARKSSCLMQRPHAKEGLRNAMRRLRQTRKDRLRNASRAVQCANTLRAVRETEQKVTTAVDEFEKNKDRKCWAGGMAVVPDL